MSFILDALKKSETDRQRQTGPALFEVKVAPPKLGLPLWALAIVVLLGVNLVIVAWVLLKRPAEATAAANTAPPGAFVPGQGMQPSYAQANYTPGANGGMPQGMSPGMNQGGYQGGYPNNNGYNGMPQGGMQVAGPGAAGPGAAGSGQQGYPQGYPQNGGMAQNPAAMGQPGMNPAMAQGGMNPGGMGGAATGQQFQNGQPFQGTMGGAGMNGAPNNFGNGMNANAANGGFEAGNPDDYAPAADGPAGNAAARGRHAGVESGLPLYSENAGGNSGMPQLRLDLHVYAARPQDRFVMINMHKLHEGDALPEGVKIESITPDGAVVTHNGSKYLLPRN